MDRFFKVSSPKSCDGWGIADFGVDEDGKQYVIGTENVNVTRLDKYSKGAKGDANLVCELLNRYYNGQIKLESPFITPG